MIKKQFDASVLAKMTEVELRESHKSVKEDMKNIHRWEDNK